MIAWAEELIVQARAEPTLFHVQALAEANLRTYHRGPKKYEKYQGPK